MSAAPALSPDLQPALSPLERFVAENRSLNAAYEASRAAWRMGCDAHFAELRAAREDGPPLVTPAGALAVAELPE